MEIPKVIEELILSYAQIEHPICKLLRDERKHLRHIHENGLTLFSDLFAHPQDFRDDSFFPYKTFIQEEYCLVSRHFLPGYPFRNKTSESFYCHRCGENYTELHDANPIDRCECPVNI